MTLEWLVGRMHVGTPDAEVRAEIRRRLKAGLSAAERKRVVDAAVRIHRRNRRLYARVMGGTL
jgi:hypothetical protein